MNDLINKIHLGDCMDFLKRLPDKSIDLVLTDPPYGNKTENMKIERTGGTWARKYQKESGLKEDIRDWEYAPQEKGRFHPTQKPIELIKRQLILF